MNGYELYNHLRGRVDRDMYADGLYRCIEGMKLEQREYFAQEVASKYIDGDGRLDWTQSRSLERLASLTAKGFYVTPLAGADYQTIINAERANALHPLDTQPYLDQIINNTTQSQENQPVAQNIESKEEMINYINGLINQYVTGFNNPTFCQSDNVKSIDALPMQGWKFHISATNLADYKRLCEVAIPEFQKLGVQFKVVRPEVFESFNAGKQQGKALTIYPDPSFSFKNFSPQLQALLCENTEKPPVGDMQIAGRIFARYGRFRKAPIEEHFISGPNGNIEYDPKKFRNVTPNFMGTPTTDSILNFYENAKEKFEKTGDFKTYMQEYYTMSECDGKSHGFMCVEIPANQVENAKYVLNNAQNNSYGLTFMCPEDASGVAKIMIHHSDIPQAFYGLANAGIQAVRPGWDVKYTYHEIAPGQEKNALGLAKEINDKYGMRAVSVVEVEKGKFALKCDTVFNQESLDMCKQRNLPIRDYEPQEKGAITKFVEKLTGKELGFTERDITDMANDLGNDTRDNQQQNIGDDDAR